MERQKVVSLNKIAVSLLRDYQRILIQKEYVNNHLTLRYLMLRKH